MATSTVKMTSEYGSNSSTHKNSREIMMQYVRTGLQDYLLKNKNVGFLNVGDIACADGRNSMDLYQMLKGEDLESPDELKKLLRSLKSAFKLKLSDLNDHSKDVERYFPNEPRVTFQKGGDFYKKIYQDHSMDLITSSIGMHWMPKEMEWSGHVYPMSDHVPDNERLKRVKIVEDLWKDIIAARAQELKPGGFLVFANAGNHSEHPFGQEYSGKTLFEVLNGISAEFGIDMQFNTYQRTKDEFEAPFKSSPLWRHVESTNITIDCSYYATYLDNRKKLGEQAALEIFARDMVASVRAFSEFRVTVAMQEKGFHGDLLTQKLDAFFMRLQEECVKSPENCHMDFKLNYLVAQRAL